VIERYSLDAVIPEMLAMYEQTAAMSGQLPTWPLPPMSPQAPAAPIARPQPMPVQSVGPVIAAPPHVPPLRAPVQQPMQQPSRPGRPSPFRG
jgi:hypothetical protein